MIKLFTWIELYFFIWNKLHVFWLSLFNNFLVFIGGKIKDKFRNLRGKLVSSQSTPNENVTQESSSKGTERAGFSQTNNINELGAGQDNQISELDGGQGSQVSELAAGKDNQVSELPTSKSNYPSQNLESENPDKSSGSNFISSELGNYRHNLISQLPGNSGMQQEGSSSTLGSKIDFVGRGRNPNTLPESTSNNTLDSDTSISWGVNLKGAKVPSLQEIAEALEDFFLLYLVKKK